MDSLSAKAGVIIELLEGVLAGTISSETAIETWQDIDREENRLFERALHDLYHYSSDEDIRSKDVQYAEYQREQLLQRIAEIRASVPVPP